MPTGSTDPVGIFVFLPVPSVLIILDVNIKVFPPFLIYIRPEFFSRERHFVAATDDVGGVSCESSILNVLVQPIGG